MMRAWIAALALVCLSAPAGAQSTTDPIETVRGFYAGDDIGAVAFYSKRLRDLYERDRRDAKGGVGRLGFAFHVNGQDTEDGWNTSLELAAVSMDEARATVQATFRNFGPQDLRYDLIRENGRWLIADVHSRRGEPWDLLTILSPKLR